MTLAGWLPTLALTLPSWLNGELGSGRRGDRRSIAGQYLQAVSGGQGSVRGDFNVAVAGVGFRAIQPLHGEPSIALGHDVQTAVCAHGGTRRVEVTSGSLESKDSRGGRLRHAGVLRDRWPVGHESRLSRHWPGCWPGPTGGSQPRWRRSSRCISGGPWWVSSGVTA